MPRVGFELVIPVLEGIHLSFSIFILTGLQILKLKKRVCERTLPTEGTPLVSVVPTFADSGCHAVSVGTPYGRIVDF
jgi:hypothetical protein